MEIKPNKPILVLIAIAIIIAIILIVQSKVHMASNLGEVTNVSKAGLFPKAPELNAISGYINTDPIKISDLKGKVIMVDFWTYSCINCIRTLPYTTAWDAKYRDSGLVIIGVHTPEFEFEKNYSNVKAAVEKFGVKYPVVLDNQYGTWNAYSNRYWPHHYLIDADGFIRYDHIGEGGYEETEQEIQKLLSEKDEKIEMGGLAASNITSETDFTKIGSPEIYLGYNFARSNLGNLEGFKPDQIVSYKIDNNGQFAPNVIYLEGQWKNNNDNMELISDSGTIILKYKAKNVNIVAAGPATGSFTLNGVVQSPGQDASIQATITFDSQRLYSVVDDSGYFQKTIVLKIKGKGFRIYTFTFG